MEAIVQIIKQLPPFAPRLAAVVVLILLMSLPQAKRLLQGAGTKSLDRAKKLLEVRKLQFDVDKLRAANPELPDSVLDRRIDRILAETADKDEHPPLPWLERLKLAGAGGIGLSLLGVLVAVSGDRWEGVELVTGVLKELVVIFPCALVASVIPARSRWIPVFYGFLMPALVVALAVTARMKA